MGSEKRKFIRAAVHCKIFIRSSSEHSIVTHTENIGEGGIRVKIVEKLVASSMVYVDICIKNKKILLEGKVTYILELEENPPYYMTGIEFHDMKKKDRRLIKNFVNKATPKEE